MFPNNTPSLRDIAIRQITEGTNRYNTSTNFEEKKQGYELFISGVQNMMKSGKGIEIIIFAYNNFIIQKIFIKIYMF